MFAPSRAIPSSRARNRLPRLVRRRGPRNAPRADGVGEGRRAQTEMRQEQHPVAARRHGFGLGDQGRVVDAGVERPEPLDRGRRRRQPAEDIIERPVDLDDALVEPVPAERRVGQRRSLTKLSASAVPRLSSSTPGRSAPGADQAADMVVAADADHAVRRQAGRPATSRARRPSAVPLASSGGRSAAGIPAASSSGDRPDPLRQVEQQRARREAVVGRPLARQPPGEIAADVEPAAGAAANISGSWRLSHSSLSRLKVGSAHRPVIPCSRSKPIADSSHSSSPVVRVSYQARPGQRPPSPPSSTPASPMLPPPPCGSPADRAAGATPRSMREHDLPQLFRIELAAVRPEQSDRRRSAALATTVPSR